MQKLHNVLLSLGVVLLALQSEWLNPYQADGAEADWSRAWQTAPSGYPYSGHGVSPATTEQQLRILYHRKFQHGFGVSLLEKQLIEDFARQQHLQPVWIEIDERWKLLPAMHQNRGDVIVSQSYDIAGGLHGMVSFTEPWALARQQLVARDNRQAIAGLNELGETEIAIKRSSTVWRKLSERELQQPQLTFSILDEDLSEETILQRLQDGVYDMAILDSDFLKSAMTQFPGLKVIYDLPIVQRKAWAVNKNNQALKQQLNEYLNRALFASTQQEKRFADLPDLKQKGVLRAISYKSPSNVYYKDGTLQGFEYELMKRFAEQHKLQLNIVFANSHQQMFELLKNGKGDVIAASVPETRQMADQFNVSSGYLHSTPVVISRNNERAPIDLLDLQGRHIVLPAESPYLEQLEALNTANDLNIDITQAKASFDTESLLVMVSLGVYDLTVIPSHTVKAELSRQENLQAAFKIAEPKQLVWLTRQQDTVLQTELNRFIADNDRSAWFNVLKNQYIANPKAFKGDSSLLSKIFTLTPYDDVIKQYAEQYGFDWRLIAAQMYQESQFDPVATSAAGAEGLMQIMPKTATELGLKDLNNPVANIEAGIRYMSKLRGRFEGDLLLMDQNWFALAAYNAGYSRVQRARKLSEEKGLNPNRWFGHVERVMAEMAEMKTASNSRLCRCGETVVYVRNIRTRYNNYIGLTNAEDVASYTARNNEPLLAYLNN